MALTTSPRGTADIFGSNLETWLKLEGYIRDICRLWIPRTADAYL